MAITLWIARQVAEALDALHTTARMIHSDVKPANIVVAPDGHATLVDLGFVHTPGESRHWSTRPVYGTLNYLAPEALTSSLAASPQSDIYSLGVTLYEIVAGVLPFVGRDVLSAATPSISFASIANRSRTVFAAAGRKRPRASRR
jgi:serine/threonine-protein kinase